MTCEATRPTSRNGRELSEGYQTRYRGAGAMILRRKHELQVGSPRWLVALGRRLNSLLPAPVACANPEACRAPGFPFRVGGAVRGVTGEAR